MQSKYQVGNEIIFYAEGKRVKATVMEIEHLTDVVQTILVKTDKGELTLRNNWEMYEYNRNDLQLSEIIEVAKCIYQWAMVFPKVAPEHRMAIILDVMPEAWNRHAQRYEIATQILALWNNAN